MAATRNFHAPWDKTVVSLSKVSFPRSGWQIQEPHAALGLALGGPRRALGGPGRGGLRSGCAPLACQDVGEARRGCDRLDGWMRTASLESCPSQPSASARPAPPAPPRPASPRAPTAPLMPRQTSPLLVQISVSRSVAGRCFACVEKGEAS